MIHSINSKLEGYNFQKVITSKIMNYIKRIINKLNQIFWHIKPSLTPRRLYLPLSKINIKKPIFLLGVQGGGLTLLARILHRHSKVIYCNGNSKFWAGRDEMQNNAHKSIPDIFTMRPSQKLFGKYYQCIYGCDALINYFKLTKKEFNRKDAKQFEVQIKKYIRAYSKKPQKARFVDKSQSYILKTSYLLKLFPDVKFLIITRNPYAICKGRSMNEQLKSYNDYNSKNITRDELLVLTCEHYRNVFEKVLEDLKDYPFYMFKFEDFIDKPKLYLDNILNYCELNKEEYLLPSVNDVLPPGSPSREKWYPIISDPNTKYLELITQRELNLMSSILDPISKKLGYKKPATPIK